MCQRNVNQNICVGLGAAASHGYEGECGCSEESLHSLSYPGGPSHPAGTKFLNITA